MNLTVNLKRCVTAILILLAVGVFLVPPMYESWYQDTAGTFHRVVMYAEDLAELIEVVKEVQQVDRDDDGHFEYVGWAGYLEAMRRASPELLESKAVSGLGLSDLRELFVLGEDMRRIGAYEVQRGVYEDPGSDLYYRLFLFIPTETDRAERMWVLIACTPERRWFQLMPPFLLVRNGGALRYCRGKNREMPMLLPPDRVPDIERLGRFRGDVWEPDPAFWKK